MNQAIIRIQENPVLAAASKYIPDQGITPKEEALTLLQRIRFCNSMREYAGQGVLFLMWEMYVSDSWVELQPTNGDGQLIGNYTYTDFVFLYLQNGELSSGYYQDMRRIVEHVLAYADATPLFREDGQRVNADFLLHHGTMRTLKKCAQKISNLDLQSTDASQQIARYIVGIAENRNSEWFDEVETIGLLAQQPFRLPVLELSLNADATWTATIHSMTDLQKDKLIDVLSIYTEIQLE